MFKTGDYVIYRRDVCKILDIKEKYYNDNDYYMLNSTSDKTLKIDIPVSDKFGLLKPLVSKDEIENIIKNIPEIKTFECNDRMIEKEYRRLMNSNNREDLIKIIKTTYGRNKERLDNNKKIGDRDDSYFKQAEKFLYNEFAIVLGMSFDDTKNYVTNRVAQLWE